MPTTTNLQFDGRLTDVAVQYRNEAFIADQVMPRKPVSKKEFTYKIYNKRDMFQIPVTNLEKNDEANEVNWDVTEATGTCKGHGLKHFVSQDDIDNAETPFNALTDGVNIVMELLALAREKRVKDLVFTAANYGGNTTDIDGATDWNDLSNDADATIQAGIDACFLPPTHAVMGEDVWKKLRRNEVLIAIIRGTLSAQEVTAEEVARHYNLQGLLIGKAKYSTANPGQTAAFARLWTKDFALLRIDAPMMKDVVFGRTFEWRKPVVQRWDGPSKGTSGGIWVKPSESVIEYVTGADVGYLVKNAV